MRRELEELRRRHEDLERALAAGRLGTWQWEIRTGELSWTNGLCRIFGYAADTFPGTLAAVLDRIHPDDRGAIDEAMRDAAERGVTRPRQFRVLHPSGEVRWVDAVGELVRGADGRPQQMTGVVSDISDRRLHDVLRAHLLESERDARREAEAASERLSLLATAGADLNSVLDVRGIMERLAEILVPTIGSFCVVDEIRDGVPHDVAVAHAEPDKLEALKVARAYRSVRGVRAKVHERIATGRSMMASPVPAESLRDTAANEEHLRALLTIAPTSLMVVPLVARGRLVGGLTLGRTTEPHFTEDDFSTVKALAARAAMAADNAALLAGHEQVARTLQQALLPSSLPNIPSVGLSARYRAAERNLEIGGDLYDVFERVDDSWAVVIGDVCGKGPAAAARTGLFRHTVRAMALRESHPAQVLRLTNEALLDQADDDRFITAVYGRVIPAPGRVHVTLAVAGHPRPVVVRADGTIEPVVSEGALLGVLPDPRLDEVELELVSGDALVLYTDGVTESRDAEGRFGDQLLTSVLAAVMPASADEIADQLVEAVLDYQGGRLADDIAVVVMQAGE